MRGLLTDVRFGLRALLKIPTFVVLAVTCLGIGIGASAMTFTVLDRALLRPLGSVDPAGLLAVAEVRQSVPDEWWPSSWANFYDWETAVGEDAQMSAYRGYSFDVSSNGSDVRVEGAYITDNLFTVLGVQPVLGPGFQAAGDATAERPVVLLSETFWRQQLGGDRAIIGQVLRVDGMPHTVVGVVPALLDVGLPTVMRSARVWVPLRADLRSLPRDDRSVWVIARLARGVSVDRFFARLDNVAKRLAATHPEDDGWTVRTGPLGGGPLGGSRSTLLLSMAAAALVLLIGCANVANLSLASSMRRRHEFGIRATVGASSWRIARQLLSESLTVATLGAALGLSIARSGLDVIARFYAADSLAPAALPIDASTLAFTIGLTVATTVLFGLFPALEAARGATRVQIAESGFGTTIARSRDGLRRGLVIGQVAASLVLLIGAALLARSFANLLALDRGVETEAVTSIRVEAQEESSAPDDVARHVQALIDALSAIAGVETAAASTNVLPLRGGGFRSAASTAAVPDPGSGPMVAYTGVTAGFFDTLGIPVLRGRSLDENEGRGNVAVVNEAMARLLWPNRDPVGSRFRLDTEAERGWITVIGVSGDFLTWDSNGGEPLPMAYFAAGTLDAYPVFYFVRKREADLVVAAESIYRAIDALDVPVKRTVITPMEQVARDPFWRQRVFSLWFIAFGGAALTLTAVGIYGVLAYLVRQRWQEIGIRMALGADRGEVLLMILRQAAVFAGGGIVIGLAGAYVLARSIRGLLFGVEPLDLALFAAVTASLAAVAMAASIAPAVRAARIDPNVLLRS